jgi:two-component system, chemotaxis family, chemotaxis protein CheY
MARILLIDDDDYFRGMLRLKLEKLGHRVTEVRNGSEGLARHDLDGAGASYDLVMTDLLMPETEGIETIVKLLEGAPDTRIIAMSGGGISFSDNHLLHMARKLGARQVLSKPFTTDALSAAIAAALD